MDEWLKDLRNVWVDMAVKGRVYPEGLGLLSLSSGCSHFNFPFIVLLCLAKEFLLSFMVSVM